MCADQSERNDYKIKIKVLLAYLLTIVLSSVEACARAVIPNHLPEALLFGNHYLVQDNQIQLQAHNCVATDQLVIETIIILHM